MEERNRFVAQLAKVRESFNSGGCKSAYFQQKRYCFATEEVKATRNGIKELAAFKYLGFQSTAFVASPKLLQEATKMNIRGPFLQNVWKSILNWLPTNIFCQMNIIAMY